MSIRNQNKFKPINYREEIHSRLHSLGQYGKEHYYTCPYCQNSEKTKFSVDYSKGKTGLFNCYKCGEKGTGYTLLKYLTGGNLTPKSDSLESVTDKIIQDSRTKNENGNDTEKKPTRFYGTLYNSYTDETGKKVFEKVKPTHSFTYRDRDGKELYRKYLATSSQFNKDKGKYEKVPRYTHKIDGIEYFGKPDIIKSIYYGLESVSLNSVCFIFEGEKKRDCFETELKMRLSENETEIFSCISSGGSTQRIDTYTIQTLIDRRVKYVVLIPDMDEAGKEFVLETKKTLDIHKIKNYILPLDLALPKQIETFSGYDIEDALKDYYPILEWILDVSHDKEILLRWNTFYTFNVSEIKFKHRYTSEYVKNNVSLEYFKGIGIKSFIEKGIQGTGKTEGIHDKIKEGKQIVYLAPRETLCKDASQRLGILSYTDIPTGKEGDCNLPISICINSLHKFTHYIENPEKYVFCLDEVDHLIRDLLKSPLIEDAKNKEHRSKLCQILVKVLKGSEMNIFTSADIPKYVYKFLELYGIEYLCITNEYEDDKIYIDLNSESEGRAVVKKLLMKGEKVSVSVNDVKKGKSLKKYIEKSTGKRVLFIEKNKTKDEERILSERDFEDFDCVIYTPTIFTGIDFNIPFGESHVSLTYNNRTVNHLEILQSCFRFRKTKNIYYYIKEIEGNQEIDSERIKIEALKRREEFCKYGSLSSEIDQNLLELYSMVESFDNQSKNNLKAGFTRLIHSRVKDIQTQCIKYEGESSEIEVEEYKKTEEDLKEEERKAVFEAKLLDPKRMSELERGSYFESDEEKFSMVKTEYINFTGIDPEEKPEEFRELLEKPIERIKAQSYNTQNLFTPIETLLEKDAQKTSSYVGDDNFISLRTIGIKEVLTTLIPDIDLSSPENLLSKPIKIDENGLQTLQTKINDNKEKERLQTLLNIQKCKNASYLMRTTLDFLGWKRESEQVRTQGKRVRRYTINLASVQKLLSFGGGVTDEC